MLNKNFYEFLNDDELLRISNKIKEMEKFTAGEIAISIRIKKSFLEKRKSLKQLALNEFIRLGINKTKDKTGILIFIILKEREFYILADSGINEKVESDTWDKIKELMESYFRRGQFCKGLLISVEEIGNILAKFFPIKKDDVNEISNMIVVR
ncbi:MAG: hypothetical protein STSR0008_13540 [Ignavibacterium sp.]